MKFNIMGFNQQMLVERYSNLNGNDVIVLRVLVDILPRMTRTLKIDGKEYKQVTYNLILEDIPFVTKSASTLKKIVQKLIDTNLIERYILNKGGKFTYFRTTEDLEKLIYIKHEKVNRALHKKDIDNKMNVASNRNKTLEVQINNIEMLNTSEDERIKAVNEIITNGEASEELIKIVTNKSIEEVKKVISGIESEFVTSKFIENAFKISHRSKRKSKVNPKSFNNFEAREYDYDTLEKKLLGWYDEDVSEVEENKFDFIHPISNYASNNSRRFAI